MQRAEQKDLEDQRRRFDEEEPQWDAWEKDPQAIPDSVRRHMT